MKNLIFWIFFVGVGFFVGGSIGSVNSSSMEPTLYPGDHFVRNLLDKNPSPNDIIQFECLNTSKCKGVIQHRYIGSDQNGCMYIEGDNSDENSLDTRDYGCLMPSEIRVVSTNYPTKTLLSGNKYPAKKISIKKDVSTPVLETQPIQVNITTDNRKIPEYQAFETISNERVNPTASPKVPASSPTPSFFPSR